MLHSLIPGLLRVHPEPNQRQSRLPDFQTWFSIFRSCPLKCRAKSYRHSLSKITISLLTHFNILYQMIDQYFFCISWSNQLERVTKMWKGLVKVRNPDVSFRTVDFQDLNLQLSSPDVGLIPANAQAHSAT